ncbi:hypothetical protein A2Z22_03735 [Candidatus Woesebacteria bacterium RBG_16_34_12]|uniref:Uncharacterized protein n=1 Tax=Candidatus Woesebacteria bacterium RBG_16_34_12 TaxID=1802480 RepID=A0A1F7X7J2_9BACT|nr:MAG: hypothetical protein A2Z22_03735 [Candidatus Woesebacteria bacterium RBG_16_34_12]
MCPEIKPNKATEVEGIRVACFTCRRHKEILVVVEGENHRIVGETEEEGYPVKGLVVRISYNPLSINVDKSDKPPTPPHIREIYNFLNAGKDTES